MGGHQLIVIRDTDRSVDEAAEHAANVLDQHPLTRSLTLCHATVAEVINDPALLEKAHLAWVLVDHAEKGQLFEVIVELQDRQIPCLLTRPDQPAETTGAIPQDGVVACPLDTPPATVCAMVQSLRSQLPLLRAMKSELSLLRAHQGGLCDQIGRIDEELRLAAQLQREFLPKSLASIGEIAFRVLFRPAGYVSGDIYDVVRLDERHIGFFIADAVGHGVPAALLTMYIKRSLITKKIDASNPRGYRLATPGEAMAKLNRDMVDSQGGKVRFATAVYGVIDCDTREVCLARAGHPFPMLLRASGEKELLEPDGGLLGVFGEETFEEVTVTLHPGDRLLLYSDGFETAFPAEYNSAPDPAGGKRRQQAAYRYIREFDDLRRGTVDEALLRLQGKLDLQSGSLNQRDDLTLLCLDVGTPQAAPAKPVTESKTPAAANGHPIPASATIAR